MAKSRKFSADRRKFLKGAAGAGAATLATPGKPAVARPARRITAPLQDPRAETGTPPAVDVLTADHCVQDAASIVRDFVKWDDPPISLGHFAESAARAYKIAMTPPMEPVLLVADSDLQERPLSEKDKLRVQKVTRTSPPQGDSGAVAETAKLLVAAQNPVIIADRAARTPAGMKYLIELAETLQAPVLDQGGRMNFPSRHRLNLSGRGRPLIAEADLILGLELTDFWGTVNAYRDQLERTSRS